MSALIVSISALIIIDQDTHCRGSGRIDTLALVDDDDDNNPMSTPSLSTMLTSSILVTGALLVGTGDCTVVGDSISVSASIQTTSSGKTFNNQESCMLACSELLHSTKYQLLLCVYVCTCSCWLCRYYKY